MSQGDKNKSNRGSDIFVSRHLGEAFLGKHPADPSSLEQFADEG